MAVETRYEHIVKDENGVPRIGDTMIKVVEVAEDYVFNGWSADEIFAQHSDYLTMGQIHSALGYYWDHKAEIDAEIERRHRHSEAMRLSEPSSPFAEKLRALKRANGD